MDIWIAVCIGFVFFATGFMGVYVSLHPPNSAREKLAWKVGFVATAIFGCGLIAWQTSRSIEQQNATDVSISSLRTDLQKSETEREVDDAYLKAKLEDYKSLQDLAPSLLKLAQATEGYTQKQYEQKQLSDGQLSKSTHDLIGKMRVLGAKCKNSEEAAFEKDNVLPSDWQQMTLVQRRQWEQQNTMQTERDYSEARGSCETEYRTQFQGDAEYLRDELISRLGGRSFEDTYDGKPLMDLKKAAIDGIFGGPDPVNDAADYLDGLVTDFAMKNGIKPR